MRQPYNPEPYSANDDISVQYELEFNGNNIKPGDKIRIKGELGKTFSFRHLAHNSKLDITWVDCFEDGGGGFRAFPIEKLKAHVIPKKSRRKKVNK